MLAAAHPTTSLPHAKAPGRKAAGGASGRGRDRSATTPRATVTATDSAKSSPPRGAARESGPTKALSLTQASSAVAIGRGAAYSTERRHPRVRLRIRAFGQDERVRSILSFYGVEVPGNEAWNLSELIAWAATTSLASASAILSMAQAMVEAGDDPDRPRATVSLEVVSATVPLPAVTADRRVVLAQRHVALADHRLAVAPATTSMVIASATNDAAAASSIHRRKRKALVLGSPSKLSKMPRTSDGVRLQQEDEEEHHQRCVRGLLEQIPERYRDGVFKRALEEGGGGSSSTLTAVPREVQQATIAMVLRKKQGSVYNAACALAHFKQWARRKQQGAYGDGLPADHARVLWYLHDTNAEAIDAADARRDRAISHNKEPAYTRGGITAAANRRAGLQYCAAYAAVPIECNTAFARALVSFSSAGRRSALFLPPILLFHFEHLSNFHPSLIVRCAAAARWIKIAAGLRTQDIRRSAKPRVGEQVLTPELGESLELHGVARRSKTSRGAPTPWWCAIVPLAVDAGVRVDELFDALPAQADFLVEAIVDADGQPCNVEQRGARFGRSAASSKEITRYAPNRYGFSRLFV